ncbi:MAG TPA: kelch repeat-containing protein, partial [Nitrospira sp.]|nr:kelch repeat-containing protein [Nitrospira sp.]
MCDRKSEFTFEQGRRTASILLLTGFCLLTVPVCGPSDDSETPPDRGAWSTAAPAPTKRSEVAASTVSDKIYVVGGFEPPGLGNVMNLVITPVLEAYDPSADQWTTKAAMPVGLHHVGIGVSGGRLYVIGGYRQSGSNIWQPVATVFAYDPATDTWAEHASMPTPRGALSVTVQGDKL